MKARANSRGKAYALSDGEGRSYEWHDVLFTMKAARAETGGAFALWDVTTRPGEEPHVHVHDDVDEIFYVLAGSITFRAGRRSFKMEKGGFVYIPLGTPHTYKISSRTVRLIGISTPSAFGDNIEAMGTPVKKALRGGTRGKR
jgi:mannose-6-phosphate isomerase-like protein (cupin superfamily)